MSYKTLGQGTAMRNSAIPGKLLIVLAAVGMVLLGSIGAEGYENYNSSKNYCGPKLDAYGRTLPSPVPSRPIPGVNFNQACYEHDKCYSQCSTNCKSRSVCDNEFKSKMELSCNSKPITVKQDCKRLAQTYYTAVHQAGAISYHCGTPACPASTAVLPMGTPSADKAFFFEHDKFAGSSAEWSKGTNVSDLTRVNTPTGQSWNDRISSLKVGSGVRVLVYEHTNFRGRCMTFSSNRNYPNLTAYNANLSGRENWNDRISSLKVTGPDQVCP
jgi:hypothetical protein